MDRVHSTSRDKSRNKCFDMLILRASCCFGLLAVKGEKSLGITQTSIHAGCHDVCLKSQLYSAHKSRTKRPSTAPSPMIVMTVFFGICCDPNHHGNKDGMFRLVSLTIKKKKRARPGWVQALEGAEGNGNASENVKRHTSSAKARGILTIYLLDLQVPTSSVILDFMHLTTF